MAIDMWNEEQTEKSKTLIQGEHSRQILARWTDDEKSLANFMLGLGLNYRFIAEATGRSEGTVRCRITRKRITADRDVERLDLAVTERSWTEDEETLLGILTNRGIRPGRIAVMLRRPKASILAKITEFMLRGSDGLMPSTRISPAVRVCISCRRKFRSEGVHHRLCNSCKESKGA